MSAGIKVRRLGDVCEVFLDGDWVESKDQSAAGIRLIQTGNVGDGIFIDRADKARYISEETFRRLRCTEIFPGDCLISRLPEPVGRSCIVPRIDGRMITSVDCTIVRFDRRHLLPEFFGYYSQSMDYLSMVARQCTGTTRSRISRSALALTPIPVPSIPEQRRIVGLLDEAFSGISVAKASAEKNLQNAQALFESHLESVFSRRGNGWVEKRLKDVFKIGSSKRVLEREWTRSGVPFYGGREVVQLAQNGVTRADAYISEEKYREISSVYGVPVEGDVLMTARGTIGVGYVVKRDDKFYYKDGNLMCLHPRVPAEPRFVLYAFQSRTVKNQLAHLTGATVTHLPIEKANALVVAFPPFHTQQKIVSRLQEAECEINRLTRLYVQKLAALAALEKSLLHQAFSGAL